MSSADVIVQTRGGMGDAIYARPFVREALRRFRRVAVETSWPWLFSDLGVDVVKRPRGLAVQQWHGDRVDPGIWARKGQTPRRTISLRYRWAALGAETPILEDMAAVSRMRPSSFALDLPPLPAPVLEPGTYAVLRPSAVRLDYAAPSREPDPAYLRTAAEQLQAMGLRVVTVGCWIPGLEEQFGEPLPADVRYENGELELPQLMALVSWAAVVVSGPCYLIPATIAAQVPHVVIAGGCGGRNNPRALAGALSTPLLRWILPDLYCMCPSRGHDCPKLITNFDARLRFDLAELDAITEDASDIEGVVV
jgi:hypothetical protein